VFFGHPLLNADWEDLEDVVAAHRSEPLLLDRRDDV
jgi:hypothetical protein